MKLIKKFQLGRLKREKEQIEAYRELEKVTNPCFYYPYNGPDEKVLVEGYLLNKEAIKKAEDILRRLEDEHGARVMGKNG